jgi:CHAT domain-containing protein
VAAALALVFRRKALSVEAIAAQRDAVLAGHYPEARAQLEELRSLRTRIARIQLGDVLFDRDPGHEDAGALVTQMEKLEAALALTVPEVALEGVLERAGLIDVATALPARSGLVEYVRFSAFDFATLQPGTDHYAAFVMTRDDPDEVAVVDLGPTRAIDRRIGQLGTIVGGSATEFDEWAEALGAAIVRPIAELVKDCTRLLIAPDSELSRIPFEVLRLDTGERVIDRFGVSYVSTGRDVLRFEAGRQRAGTTPVVIADPDFDLAASSAHADRRSSFADQVAVPLDRATRFERLPGTRVEGRRVADLLSVTPWQGEAATEARLKAAHSPRILHIATHGFFLEMDQNQGPNSVVEVGFESESGSFTMIRRTVDPLLRSGLVLAGVNAFLEGRTVPESMEDGILTAEDVAGLDLVDTELVVLSACETGLGDVHDGEGVFGLQRAVEIAGAQSLIMSLWKVPDEATADLMTELYTQLAAGKGPADALRSAQLKIQTRLPHPLHWGAFVCRGNPCPLGNSREPDPIHLGQVQVMG